jgi:hypothetical protein
MTHAAVTACWDCWDKAKPAFITPTKITNSEDNSVAMFLPLVPQYKSELLLNQTTWSKNIPRQSKRMIKISEHDNKIIDESLTVFRGSDSALQHICFHLDSTPCTRHTWTYCRHTYRNYRYIKNPCLSTMYHAIALPSPSPPAVWTVISSEPWLTGG